MPGIARLNAGVVRIGRQLAKRRNIMWRLEFDLSLEQNSPEPKAVLGVIFKMTLTLFLYP